MSFLPPQSPKPVFTLDDLRRWEGIAPTLSPPATLAVIGDPIGHSRSPQMHNPALAARGLAAQYIRVQVPPGSVADSLRLFARHGFTGVNCTIPHKFEALAAVDETDPLAAKLGAVNTIRIRDGRLTGFNSDGPGFLRSVEEAFGRPVRDLRVLIVGAGGGAGRAVAMQCALECCPVLFLANRTPEKMPSLTRECRDASSRTHIESIPCDADSLARAMSEIDLLVNATTLGMRDTDPPPVDVSKLRPAHLVLDMVYRGCGETPLLAAARAAGAGICGGLTLLLHQGAISFRHWHGEPVPLEEMRRGLETAG